MIIDITSRIRVSLHMKCLASCVIMFFLILSFTSQALACSLMYDQRQYSSHYAIFDVTSETNIRKHSVKYKQK